MKHIFQIGQTVRLRNMNSDLDNHPYMTVTGFSWRTDDRGKLLKDEKGRFMLGGIRTGWFDNTHTYIEKEWHSEALEPIDKTMVECLNEALYAKGDKGIKDKILSIIKEL